jgi:DNA-binding transcriptional regulator of glucitol operon
LSPLFLIVVLAVVWMLQSFFVYRQGKAFMRRIHELRQQGRVAIGVGYNRFRIRTFIVVVADSTDRVARIERLSGLTIFARVRPVERYSGLPLTEVVDVAMSQQAPRQFTTALKQAVDALIADRSGGTPAGDADPQPEEEGDAPRDEERGLPIAQAI